MNNLKTVLLLTFLFTSITVFSQKVIGEYEQISINAPDEYRDSEHEVTIKRDANARKKIWIYNLIPNQKFYAIKYLVGDDSEIYTVPKQHAGNYLINTGCINYKNVDEYDEDFSYTVSIHLNNEMMCKGIYQEDYQTEIGIDTDGINVGDIELDKNGKVKAGKHVGIGKNKGIKINTKDIMTGIMYVGKKYGTPTHSSDSDDDSDSDIHIGSGDNEVHINRGSVKIKGGSHSDDDDDDDDDDFFGDDDFFKEKKSKRKAKKKSPPKSYINATSGNNKSQIFIGSSGQKE